MRACIAAAVVLIVSLPAPSSAQESATGSSDNPWYVMLMTQYLATSEELSSQAAESALDSFVELQILNLRNDTARTADSARNVHENNLARASDTVDNFLELFALQKIHMTLVSDRDGIDLDQQISAIDETTALIRKDRARINTFSRKALDPLP